MRFTKRHWLSGLLVCVAGAALALPARAGGISDFKLTGAVPADAAVAIYSRNHDGKKFVQAQFQRVWDELEKQRLDRDLKRLVKSAFEEDGANLEEFEQRWQQFSDLLAAINWSTLGERETAFAMRVNFPISEMVVLCMPPADKVKADFDGLTALVKTLVGLAPVGDVVLNTDGADDSVVHRISFPNLPPPLNINIVIVLARQKDVVLFGLGQALPDASLALLKGGKGATLASTERFQTAFKRLPPPSDAMVFVDLAALMTQFRGVFDQVMSEANKGGQMDAQIQALPRKLVDAIDLWEYTAAVSRTEGMRTTTDSVLLLREGASSKALFPVLYTNGPLKDPLKYIPKSASNFSVSNGLNPLELYNAVLAFLKTNVPNGENLVQQWNELKQGFPLDPEKDLLGWMRGGMTTFVLPGASQYSPGDWVFMLGVKDDAQAKASVDKIIEMIQPFLEQQKGSASDANIPGADGFVTINMPMLMMLPGFGAPTLGIKDGQLMVGSSPKAIGAALATARGETENVSKNERFQKEGLPVGSNVTSVSFKDLSRLGEELGQALAMVPMIAMFNPEISKSPIGRTLMSVVGKAGAVVKKLDFLLSSASISTFDGKSVVTKQITNYQQPPPPKAPPSEGTPEGSGDQPTKDKDKDKDKKGQ